MRRSSCDDNRNPSGPKLPGIAQKRQLDTAIACTKKAGEIAELKSNFVFF
jgi:hypothetical protein